MFYLINILLSLYFTKDNIYYNKPKKKFIPGDADAKIRVMKVNHQHSLMFNKQLHQSQMLMKMLNQQLRKQLRSTTTLTRLTLTVG